MTLIPTRFRGKSPEGAIEAALKAEEEGKEKKTGNQAPQDTQSQLPSSFPRIPFEPEKYFRVTGTDVYIRAEPLGGGYWNYTHRFLDSNEHQMPPLDVFMLGYLLVRDAYYGKIELTNAINKPFTNNQRIEAFKAYHSHPLWINAAFSEYIAPPGLGGNEIIMRRHHIINGYIISDPICELKHYVKKEGFVKCQLTPEGLPARSKWFVTPGGRNYYHFIPPQPKKDETVYAGTEINAPWFCLNCNAGANEYRKVLPALTKDKLQQLLNTRSLQ